MFLTTTAIRPTLERKGALSDVKDKLALVVKDAMELVVSLGERYLWVDTYALSRMTKLNTYRSTKCQLFTAQHTL
jgi:hypothetical protein